MRTFFHLFAVFAMGACTPSFLDEKPSSSLVVPRTLRDYQQLLDNEALFSVTSHLPDLMSDDCHLEEGYWKGLSDRVSRKSHTWEKDVFDGPDDALDDWNTPYSQVFYANVVLDGLEAIPVGTDDKALRDGIRGAALFFRAHAFFNLVQLFSEAYGAGTATEDTGIPLPVRADVNRGAPWATVQQAYDRIVDDLEIATGLLGNNVDIRRPIRPSHPAAMALLARVHLHMHRYGQARIYADKALGWHAELLDFNGITSFPANDNPEYLFYSKIAQSALIGRNRTNVLIDGGLYGSYVDGDLRKALFYGLNGQGKPFKRAGFGRAVQFFSGLSTSEMLLIRAECAARAGDLEAAMGDLNVFRESRYDRRGFRPIAVENQAEALEAILSERRKEFVFRGLRWGDIRRLNAEGARIGIRRVLGDREYDLRPGGGWAFPIPPNEARTQR